jgi:hypothetical protein
MKYLLKLTFAGFLLANLASAQTQSARAFELPLLITSAGQSADVTMAGMLCKKIGVESKVLPRAGVSDLEGIKTLMIVPGFSSKGLGAAGTSREQELERVEKLIAAAKERSVRILVLHLGGKARRGPQSDDFNRIAGEASERMIVVKQGDEDKFFTNLSAGKKIPLEVVDKIAGVTTPLSAVLKKP